MSNKFNKITVLGAARSGFSAAKLLSIKGKDVFVSELGIIPEGIKAKNEKPQYKLGRRKTLGKTI